MTKKIIFVLLGLMLVISTTALGGEKDSHLYKNNALGFKAGAHFWESSDFFDFWGIDESDLTGFAGELTYERKLSRHTGIELSFGYTWSEKAYSNVLVLGDISEIELSSFYISPSLKFYIPAGNTVVFYLGVGPDVYFSDWDYNYTLPNIGIVVADDHDINFGAHGLVGIEFYVYKHPAKHGWYDAPISLFFEYKYTWVEWGDADRILFDPYNNVAATLGLPIYPTHDLDVGGHSVFAGLRWHF